MTSPLQPTCALNAACKCCGAESPLFGVADFHKNCHSPDTNILPLSGIPIYYHRCQVCGFLFTAAFDGFTPEDFSRHIYNADYARVDPDFLESRPCSNASAIRQMFGGTKSLRLLDYGGGNGTLAKRLRESGFTQVETYDPFVPEHAQKPSGRYDCVVSFEVMEHSPRPRETLAEMASLLAENGLILFSTLLQGENVAGYGMNWWYIGPRNGHVSLFSRQSLLRISEPLGFQFGSFSDGLHILFRQVPAFARHLIQINPRGTGE